MMRSRGGKDEYPHPLDLRSLARALGGEISGRQILAPGPGHSRGDRSLSIRIEPQAPDGFLVHSFAGDNPIICKNYIRQQLGLPEWQPGDEQNRRVGAPRRARFDRMAIDREVSKRSRTETIKSVSSARLQSGMREAIHAGRSLRPI
jgi:hypothetical protein